jgi:hypothetical protein
MAYAGQTGDTGQTGGQSQPGWWLQQPHKKCSRKPQWLLQALEQNHLLNSTYRRRKPYTKPSKTSRNLPRTDQQHHEPKPHELGHLPEANPTRALHRSDRWEALVRLVKPMQLGMNSNPQVNSPKSKPWSPNSLHGFAQDFWDSRNTSWALHSQHLVD